MYELRPYQAEAKQAILKAWEEGQRKTLLVLPTGCGKTVVFSSVAAAQVAKGHRVLVMAHRGELLDQAAEKLLAFAGIHSVLEKAESTSLGSFLPVTVASVQSLSQEKRLEQFPCDYFQDIIVDEAHHCLSDSYKRVLEHFPKANILGVTATPDRGDMKNLGEYFDSKAYEYSLPRAIREGYLSPIRAQMIPLTLDIQNVRVTNGDYTPSDVGSALEPYLRKITTEMVRYCQGRRTVVFLPLVATSQKFCAMLREAGLRSAEVNGNSKDRAEVLHDFENGKYDVLCNSMLLTEGWDCPAVDCIVILRPTKCTSLYRQMVGRGMRLAPGKEFLLLLDFLWMTVRHDLCRPSALLGKDERIVNRIDKKLSQDDGIYDLIEAEEEAERDIIALREKSLKAVLEAQRARKQRLVDPLQYFMSIEAEDLASYEPTFPWEMEPPTKAQLAYLEKRGIYPEDIKNAGLASIIIDRLNRRREEELTTPKQIRLLERYGFRRVGTWQFDDASRLIDKIAHNRWQVPLGVDIKTYVPKRRLP